MEDVGLGVDQSKWIGVVVIVGDGAFGRLDTTDDVVGCLDPSVQLSAAVGMGFLAPFSPGLEGLCVVGSNG